MSVPFIRYCRKIWTKGYVIKFTFNFYRQDEKKKIEDAHFLERSFFGITVARKKTQPKSIECEEEQQPPAVVIKKQQQKQQQQQPDIFIPKKPQQCENVKKIQHLKKVNIYQRPQDMLSKVQKCTKSSFNGNPKKQNNLDLFKLPGSDYIKPGLLTKTKDQLAAKKADAFTTSNVKQKPSCELFAPQPKRVFTKDYSHAIKHLLAADNKVKPPVKLEHKRKLVKKPAKEQEVDIWAIIEKDRLNNKHVNVTTEMFKKYVEPSRIMKLNDVAPKNIVVQQNVVQNQPTKIVHQNKTEVSHPQGHIVQMYFSRSQTIDYWMESVLDEFSGVSGIPGKMKQPPLTLEDRAKLCGINLRKRNRSPSSSERREISHQNHKKIVFSSDPWTAQCYAY